MAQPSTGTFLFNPALSDLVLEAYSRCQIRAASLTAQHMLDARMSAQLLLAEWTTKIPTVNLWRIELLQIPLTQGVPTYVVPQNVVANLDYYISQFELGNTTNLTPQFSTSGGGGFILTESGQTILTESGLGLQTEAGGTPSATVTIYWPSSGVIPGQFINVIVPVSVGGLVISGFYQVQSIVDVNHFTITATKTATTGVTNGGVVPQFTPNGTTTVLVTFPNHGYFANQLFTVQVPTAVGGQTLSGPYTISSVVDANNFNIAIPFPALASAPVFENGGKTQLTSQLTSVNPFDRVVTPISRTEYSSQPNKLIQAFPTTVWWDRLINSTVTLWPVPDGNGPYVLNIYAMTQIQDAQLEGGVGLDMPYRFLEAFAAGLAAKLARKFPPPTSSGVTIADLRMEAEAAWQAAAQQDSEGVPWFILPGLANYFNSQ